MANRRTLSTGAQLTALLVAVVFAGYLAAGWIALRISTGEQLRQIDQTLTESVSGTSDLIETLTADQLEALRRLPSSVTVQQLDTDGRPIDASVFGPASVDTAIDLSSRTRSQLFTTIGKPFSMSSTSGKPVRVMLAPSRTGYFVGIVPLSAVRSSEDRLAGQLTAVGLGAALAVGLLIWGGVGTILAPMRTMIANARRIGAGEPDVTLDLQHGASEVRELGTSLDDMRRSLNDSAQRLQRFAADASHDLRTPIAIIRGHTQLARAGTPSPDAWDDVDRESKRMQQLVDDLWLLARLDQHNEPVFGLVDLTDIADAAVSGAQLIDDTRTYERVPSAAPALVSGDERQLRRVFDNLLANIESHTPAGTLATVRISATDRIVSCQVIDTGQGMDDGDRANATERFWRADRARRTPGSGLGLAIVEAIVDAHNGTVVLSSGDSGGLVVSIEIPSAVTPSDR
jgi:two-component system, OmpR family, sensor kinase